MFIPAACANDTAAPQQPRYAATLIALGAAVWLAACRGVTEPAPDGRITPGVTAARGMSAAATDTLPRTSGASSPTTSSDSSGTGRKDRLIWW